MGLSRRRLMRAAADTWVRVTPHVFGSTDQPLSEPQLRMAGVLEGGPLAALAGCSALIEQGWHGSAAGWVDIVEPRGQRRRMSVRPEWLRVHHPRVPARVHGDPARTSSARAAVDAARWARSDREAVMILTSTVQQRLVGLQALDRELTQRRVPGRAHVIRDALLDIAGGASSSNEAAFLRECRRRGLPTPRMQEARVNGARRTDAEFFTRSGRLLIVEIDGIGHLDVATWQADIARHNDLTLTTGALVLRVTGWDVRHDPEAFFGVLGRALDDEW